MSVENDVGGEVDRVFREHYASVHRAVTGLVHDPGEAADLTQETFARAYQALPQFRGDSSVRTWLIRIAQNVVLDRFRRLGRRRAGALPGTEGADLEALPQEGVLSQVQVVERQESDACVQRCVDTLPDAYRQAVVLHDMVGMTAVEIASLLKVSLATVKIRLHRGRTRLRSTVGEHCELYRDERNVLSCRHKPRGEDRER